MGYSRTASLGSRLLFITRRKIKLLLEPQTCQVLSPSQQKSCFLCPSPISTSMSASGPQSLGPQVHPGQGRSSGTVLECSRTSNCSGTLQLPGKGPEPGSQSLPIPGGAGTPPGPHVDAGAKCGLPGGCPGLSLLPPPSAWLVGPPGSALQPDRGPVEGL